MARSAETTVDPDSGEELEKIVVELPCDHWTGYDGERVWAKPLGGGRYEVRNTPWYAYDVSWGDVVRCEGLSPAGLPVVRERVERGGHETFRVYFPKETPAAARTAIVERLVALGATYEQADESHYAIDVAPGVPLDALLDVVRDEERRGALDWERGWS